MHVLVQHILILGSCLTGTNSEFRIPIRNPPHVLTGDMQRNLSQSQLAASHELPYIQQTRKRSDHDARCLPLSASPVALYIRHLNLHLARLCFPGPGVPLCSADWRRQSGHFHALMAPFQCTLLLYSTSVPVYVMQKTSKVETLCQFVQSITEVQYMYVSRASDHHNLTLSCIWPTCRMPTCLPSSSRPLQLRPPCPD